MSDPSAPRAPAPGREGARPPRCQTRQRLLDHLVATGRPVGVGALASALGLHPNAVRHHLAQLAESGLVQQEQSVARGRGRPPTLFRATTRAAAGLGRPDPTERLAAALLLARRGTSLYEAGRMVAADVAVPALDDAVHALAAALRAEGFQPRLRPGAAPVVILQHCPLAALADLDPATVCAVHHGIVDALAERAGGLRTTAFEPAHPHTGSCRLHLERTASGD